MIIINKYIVIGNPIKHSISPFIHNNFFDSIKKRDNIYNSLLVENLDKNVIDNFFKEKIKGINVTLPYKIDIIKYLYKIDKEALMIGSVNTLKYTENGYIGYNTDIYGMEDTFLENNVNIKDKTVLIIGAGGSGYTASFMAIKNKAKKIIIANRTYKNSVNLKEHILNYYKNENIHTIPLENINETKNVDIVINTTTLGFLEKSEISPLDDSFFKNNKVDFVFDIIYTPLKNKLLKIAENNNIKNTNGFSMLIYQALKSQEIWQDININLKDKISFKNEMLKKYNKLKN